MPIVFVPSMPMRYSAFLNTRVPVYDTSAADEWGNVQTLLDIERSLLPHEMTDAIAELCEKLEGISVDDYIVAIGDPVLVSAAVGCALLKSRYVKMLRWNRITNGYQPIEVKLP